MIADPNKRDGGTSPPPPVHNRLIVAVAPMPVAPAIVVPVAPLASPIIVAIAPPGTAAIVAGAVPAGIAIAMVAPVAILIAASIVSPMRGGRGGSEPAASHGGQRSSFYQYSHHRLSPAPSFIDERSMTVPACTPREPPPYPPFICGPRGARAAVDR